MIEENLGALVLILTNLGVLIATFYRIKHRVEEAQKGVAELSERLSDGISEIEKKRLENVKVLREIYDAKIMDAKLYAKGLFELREGEVREISKRMGALESKFDNQATLMNQKFDKLIESNAYIVAHIETNEKTTRKK